ncbi:hypothetical protein [Mycobacteroides abscessus]|uniref:hypothetical protein n=1 Tax=Mycobacteroides abscessus TaxID=36809 RepID=UPI0009A56F0B|nr:hypothetical protein [Mycobacteroides abscessus]SLC88129.1 Uncharacterised protein [Mycobacteroides abscessus subsp. abscessus]SLG80141.1 Uncharacterised protein [Mycobacteroides abscessus subsp. abscessus]
MRQFASIIGGSIVIAAMLAMAPQMFRMLQENASGLAGTSSPPPAAPRAPVAEAPIDVPWDAIGVALAVIAGIAIGALLVRRYRTGKARRFAHRQGQLDRWAKGACALAAVKQSLIEFECDPMASHFTRRLLADVNEPASAAFYVALGEAEALHTEAAPGSDEQIAAFVSAALAAERAFGAANENAVRKARLGISHGGHILSAAERQKLAQAQVLMAQALDESSTAQFAKTAIGKARELLDLVGAVVPERLAAKAVLSVERVHRQALPA